MKTSTKIWPIFQVLLVFLPIPAIPQNTSTITGSIEDEENNPVVGVNIILDEGKYATISNSEGIFEFKKIPKKAYHLKASSIGYYNYKQTIDATKSEINIEITLKKSILELDEAVVRENVKKKRTRKESVSIQLIQQEFLKEAKAGNLMQTLKKIPGINSMDVGTGISKPMIRGMGYYRVVVAQNGIKQEGQQWSNHHGISVDQQSVNHVEIIKGPASLQYSSDAIGGVINILPTHVPLSGGLSGEISFTGKTNTNWLGGSGTLSARKRDIYFVGTITHNSYSDFRIPATDSYLMPAPVSASEASHEVTLGDYVYNTAGNENAVSLVTGIIKSWGNSYFEFAYHKTKMGFFDWQGTRYDSIRELHTKNYRDIQQPFQEVNNFSINHYTNRYFNENKLEIALGYQYNSSTEHNYLSDRTGNRNKDLVHFSNLDNLELLLDLQAISGNVFYTMQNKNNNTVKLGINTQYQIHNFDGYSHILPEYNRLSTGGFITYKYNISKTWTLNSGIRFDYNNFRMDESLNPDPEYGDSIFNPYFTKNYPVFAYSAGLIYLPDNNTTYKVNIGKSYRVPSAYELGAYGLHRHEGRFEKGNISNKPEQAWQLDLGFEKEWDLLNIFISPFLNYFSNYLYLNPTPNLRSEGQVYSYQQSKAMLAGGEISFGFSPKSKLKWNTGAEYVYAVNLDLNMAVPFTPPLSILSEISYFFKPFKTLNKSQIGFEALWVASQKYTVPNELTTPGYFSFNINAISEFNLGNQKFNLMLKVRNLTDNKYFNHISFYRRLRIPEPGRDIQLFVSIPF